MALGINTNVASLSAQNQLGKSQNLSNQALERLSSGLRINSAKDDAAGLAISSRFQAQISGLNVAQRNANDGISLAQTAEGALDELGNIAQRIRDLAVQSANDTNSASDRAALNEEVGQLIEEADRIADTTQFNNLNILNGNLPSLNFQVGANANQTISVTGIDARASSLGRTTLTSEVTGFGGSVRKEAITATNTLTINGTQFTAGAAGDFESVADLAAAINKTDFGSNADVTASQLETTKVNLGSYTGAAAGTITINGTQVTLNDGTNGLSLDKAIEAINEKSIATGVVASKDSSDNLILEDTSGKSFTVAVDDAARLGNITDAANNTFEAGLVLSVKGGSADDLTVTGAESGAGVLGLAGTKENRTLKALDISDRPSANKAIETIDSVIDQINTIRGELGATQNRFESTINNLATSAENLSAANSRILDADFAAETAKLSKSQVLQQAGISVLAQANARPQQVLSLLQ
ncbi:flagellin N-terminal helical domain-containing protein [Marinobacter nauticus]|uniref:flagellin N-terminal helical domain-containing protein n=1 Tax=Marinobacter nauticus TaxID=2743 RepID=UPI001CFEE41D|nr:flagellin [Marinobacter nauticus]